MAGMIRILTLFGVLAIAGCGGYAPRVTDPAGSYQKDVVACQTDSAAAVDRQNAKTGLTWLISPARRPFQVRRAIRGCLEGKGYVLAA